MKFRLGGVCYLIDRESQGGAGFSGRKDMGITG